MGQQWPLGAFFLSVMFCGLRNSLAKKLRGVVTGLFGHQIKRRAWRAVEAVEDIGEGVGDVVAVHVVDEHAVAFIQITAVGNILEIAQKVPS